MISAVQTSPSAFSYRQLEICRGITGRRLTWRLHEGISDRAVEASIILAWLNGTEIPVIPGRTEGLRLVVFEYYPTGRKCVLMFRCLVAFMLLIPLDSLGQSRVPQAIPYVGFLATTPTEHAVTIEVRLLREEGEAGWSTVWCERHPQVAVVERRFFLNIGRPAWPAPQDGEVDARVCEPIAGENLSLETELIPIFSRGTVWLQLSINGSALPKQQFLTVPSALVAETAQSGPGIGMYFVQREWCNPEADLNWAGSVSVSCSKIVSAGCKTEMNEVWALGYYNDDYTEYTCDFNDWFGDRCGWVWARCLR